MTRHPTLPTAIAIALAFAFGSPAAALVITDQPDNTAVPKGDTATLTVAATSIGTLSNQWFRGRAGNKNHPRTGGTNSTFTTGNVFATRKYWVELTDRYITNVTVGTNTVASNVVLTATSRTATVTFTNAAEIDDRVLVGEPKFGYKENYKTYVYRFSDEFLNPDAMLLTNRVVSGGLRQGIGGGVNTLDFTNTTPFSLTFGGSAHSMEISGELGDDPDYRPGDRSCTVDFTGQDEEGHAATVAGIRIKWSSERVHVSFYDRREGVLSPEYEGSRSDRNVSDEGENSVSFSLGDDLALTVPTQGSGEVRVNTVYEAGKEFRTHRMKFWGEHDTH